jgi:CDP-glycerol glycerophosphotransferase (TagB/SpsB family)
MTIFDYLLPIIYKPLWSLQQKLQKTKDVAFYAADPLDYEMFLPILKHLDMDVIFIAKNAKTCSYFQQNNIPYIKYPFFPKAVIMGRHAAFKFPASRIVKIGFDHGLYQFKRWTKAKYYNQFDAYFVSSESQVESAKKLGITSVHAIGYPKLDKAFDGSIVKNDLSELREKLNLDPHKKTVIFTSTWDVGGLSALTKWIDRVHALTDTYNVLLTAHPWTKKHLLQKLKAVSGATFLPEADVTTYLMLADVFIGDYNSLIGEFCALDKPIITFRTPVSNRSVAAVRQMIAEISYQVDDFDDLPKAIEHCCKQPNEKSAERNQANKLLFKALDGKAGIRAADKIKEMICESPE